MSKLKIRVGEEGDMVLVGWVTVRLNGGGYVCVCRLWKFWIFPLKMVLHGVFRANDFLAIEFNGCYVV
jgi:hypothetical protein